MSEWRSDSDLILQIASSAQAEAMACSRRLTAIGELHARRQILVEDDCGRELWSCDVWDAVSAEVAAAQGITQAAASEQLRYALALKDRLPGVGALFAQGPHWLQSNSGRSGTYCIGIGPGCISEDRCRTSQSAAMLGADVDRSVGAGR